MSERVYEPKGFTEPLLNDLINTVIAISKITFDTAGFGEYALVTVGGKVYRTSSKVLLKQLKEINQLNPREDSPVKTKLVKVKQYLTFAKP